MAGVAESRIKRSNYVFGAGVIYCLYAVYACGVDAMLGSAVAVSIGLVIYVLRKAWATRKAHRLQESID
jgi:transporter, basic amino acid/polyamine antiporter (APA) family protein